MFPWGQQDPVNWAARRVELTKKYDQDADGILNAAEREALRKDRFTQGLRESRGGRGMFRMMWPPEVIKKYDKNTDGELDEEEGNAARQGIGRQMEQITKQYDKNTNGRLDEDEMAAVRTEIDAGRIEGVPRMMFMPQRQRGFPGMGGGGPTAREEILRKADANGDGTLNDQELKTAREALDKAKLPTR